MDQLLGETVSRGQTRPRATRIGGEGSSTENVCKGFPSKNNLQARGATRHNKNACWVGDMERGEEPCERLSVVSEQEWRRVRT
jgi:hypothetical protein